MWETILDYFKTLEQRPIERMTFLVGGLLFFWIVEGAIPLFQGCIPNFRSFYVKSYVPTVPMW